MPTGAEAEEDRKTEALGSRNNGHLMGGGNTQGEKRRQCFYNSGFLVGKYKNTSFDDDAMRAATRCDLFFFRNRTPSCILPLKILGRMLGTPRRP